MSTPQPARLYQKKSGIFFVRVLLATTSASRKESTKKKELRCTLKTKSRLLARTVSLYLNALLEHVPVHDRENAVTNFLSHTISAWTLPGGISASDDDDQKRLLEFLAQKPALEQALVACLQNMTGLSGPGAQMLPALLAAFRQGSATPQGIAFPPTYLPVPSPGPGPSRTMRLSSALDAYRARYNGRLATQNDRTTADKNRLFDNFTRYLSTAYPELTDDPLVHEIETRHIDGFLEEQAKRPARGESRNSEDAKTVGANTLLKKLGDFRHFFDFLLNMEKVILNNPVSGMQDAVETWSKQAAEEAAPYIPFSSGHLTTIFSPQVYLAASREPDHFWCPLLGVHLGCRLGEIVNRRVEHFGRDESAGVWYLDVPEGKNENSIRRLPITQPLIDLGFVRYVEHVRNLGGEYLFPHRDWNTITAQRQASKTTSTHFGKMLDGLGIRSRQLVFHSFRHTVITLLHDAGVSLSIAMQICGHEAQDHAVRSGTLTEEQARSVHLGTYTHADLARPGTDYPILKMRDALERAVQLPLDYQGLAQCAEIVRSHLKKVGGEFRSGWPAQREAYTAQMVARIKPQLARAS